MKDAGFEDYLEVPSCVLPSHVPCCVLSAVLCPVLCIYCLVLLTLSMHVTGVCWYTSLSAAYGRSPFLSLRSHELQCFLASSIFSIYVF